MMILAIVYEKLATNEDEISTDELVALAKAFAEIRRAESSSREFRRSNPSREPAEGRDSDDGQPMTQAVRDLYGTSLDHAASDGACDSPRSR